jgi:histone H1/5
MDLQFVFGNPVRGKPKKVKKKSIAKAKKLKNNKTVKSEKEDVVAKKKAKKKAAKKTKKVAVKKAKATKKKSSAKKASSKKVKRTKKVRAKSKATKRKVKVVGPSLAEYDQIKGYLSEGKKKKKKTKKAKSTRRRTRRTKSKKTKSRVLRRVAHSVTGYDKKSKKKVRGSKKTYFRKSVLMKERALAASNVERANALSRKKKFRKVKKKLQKRAKGIQAKVKKAYFDRREKKADLSMLKAALKTEGYTTKEIKKLTNPFGGAMIQIQKYLGHDVKEIAGLAAGGAIYGAVNGMTAKYAKPVHDALVKVPVVGTALPSLLVGVGLMVLADRVKAAAPAAILGKGLIGASVVGMGVNASQLIPALQTLKGADFGSLQREAALMGSMGSMGSADFGHAGQMGGIDYTMNGIDVTPMHGIDYTMEGADFGVTPEGLGHAGQMG